MILDHITEQSSPQGQQLQLSSRIAGRRSEGRRAYDGTRLCGHPAAVPESSLCGGCGTSDSKAENSIAWVSAHREVFGKGNDPVARQGFNVRFARDPLANVA